MEKISLHNYQAYLLDFAEGTLSRTGQEELFFFLAKHPELKKELEDFENFSLNDYAGNEGSFSEKDELKKNSTADELLIGYIENTLSLKEKQLLEKQLAGSADLREQLRLYKLTIVPADQTVLYHHKEELHRQLVTEEQLFAYAENIMSLAEKAALEQQLRLQPLLSKEIDLYKAAVLSADATVVYPDKEELKRETKIIPLPQLNWNYAAVAASVLLLIGLFYVFSPGKKVAGKAFAWLATPGIKFPGRIISPVQKNENTSLAAVPRPAGQPANNIKNRKQPGSGGSLIVQPDMPLIAYSPGIDSLQHKNEIAPVTTEPRKEALVMNKAMYDETNDEAMGNDRLTTKQYIAQKIQEAAWGPEENTGKQTAKKRLSGFDVVAALAKKLKNLGNKKTDAKVEYDDEKETSEYTLTFGKLSISRTKASRE